MWPCHDPTKGSSRLSLMGCQRWQAPTCSGVLPLVPVAGTWWGLSKDWWRDGDRSSDWQYFSDTGKKWGILFSSLIEPIA